MALFKSSSKSAPKKSGGKKKKQVIKLHIECKNPAEDGILKTFNFVCLLYFRKLS